VQSQQHACRGDHLQSQQHACRGDVHGQKHAFRGDHKQSQQQACRGDVQPQTVRKPKPPGPGPSIPSKKYGELNCWSCQHFKKSPNEIFCNSCAIIQPPRRDTDYFTLFGLPQTFDINPTHLDKSFLRLQRQLHPDLFTQKSSKEQTISTSYSSMLNAAYQTLKAPISRLLYLLSLCGVDTDTVYRSETDRDLLLEMMEKRERLEVASVDELKQMNAENTEEMDKLFRTVAHLMEARDLDAAVRTTSRLLYHEKLRTELHELLPAE